MNPELRIPARGDGFVLGSYEGFGVILAVNPERGVAPVAMQNGSWGELALGAAQDLVERLRKEDPS